MALHAGRLHPHVQPRTWQMFIPDKAVQSHTAKEG